MANDKYPYMSVNGAFYTKEALDEAWAYLDRMAPLWRAGICDPTPTDKIAYAMMKQITMRPVMVIEGTAG